MFPFLQNITMTIDAIYERHTDNATIIFSGNKTTEILFLIS